MELRLRGRKSTRYSRSRAAIMAACVLIIGVVWAVTYERIQFEREDDITEAVKANKNLVLAFEEHTNRTLLAVDQALMLVKYEYAQEGHRMEREWLIGVMKLDPAAYVFLAIADERGDLVMGTNMVKGVNVADREYFMEHQRSHDGGLRVGRLAASRVSGKNVLQLSRRIELAAAAW